MTEPATKKRQVSPPPTEQPEQTAISEKPTTPEATEAATTTALPRPADTETGDEPASGLPQATNTDRAARFAALKARATESARSNLAAAKAEAQRSAINPSILTNLSRRSAVAQHKLLKADTEAEEGDGAFERKRAWDYTIDEAERWDERVARKKEARDNNAFQDFSREAAKIYDRQIHQLDKSGISQKDRAAYEEQKAKLIEDAARSGGLEIIETQDGELVAIDNDGKFYATSDSTGFAESKPKKENVDRLVADLRKAEEVRLKKRRARGQEQDQGDVTFINEKNKQFNMKLARFYDRYTKEIRDSFERGTAL
ncbi:hypothetical protein DV735_g1706, partial [Chaetothyriales sp. CBS 134920]